MKETSFQLYKALQEVKSKIIPGTTWKHYKGGIYVVDGAVVDTDDGSIKVTYHRFGGPDFNIALESNIIFARPAEEWFTDVIGDADHFEPRFKQVRKVERWHTDEEIEALNNAPVV